MEEENAVNEPSETYVEKKDVKSSRSQGFRLGGLLKVCL